MSTLYRELCGNIVDLVNGVIFRGTIRWIHGVIVDIDRNSNVQRGPYIIPGFIDAHVHVESSMLVPSEFARSAVLHGTVGSVSDPHEIANVCGLDGISFMLDNAAQSPFKFCFGVPSCVPATKFETSGAKINAFRVKQMLKHPQFYCLSEVMNYPGVLNEDAELLAKITAAHKNNKPVDGHAPGLAGDELRKYAGYGISTDHECTSLSEALEKIDAGMKILIREGSAAKNFDDLHPLLSSHPDKVMFCTDDLHPDDLVVGHINKLCSRAVGNGHDVMNVLRASSMNAINHYRIPTGLLQPGDPATFTVVDNLTEFNVQSTYIDGACVAHRGQCLTESVPTNAVNFFETKYPTLASLHVIASKPFIRVIEARDGQLLTGEKIVPVTVKRRAIKSDTRNDILKIVVVNRYKKARPMIGFVQGFGLRRGAFASSIAHDSHNIVAVGVSDEDILSAISTVIHSKGGISVADSGSTRCLPLPVAGLMSTDNVQTVSHMYQLLNSEVHRLGSTFKSPFMTLSFMSLLVIPSLKISDKGLFDGNEFCFVPLDLDSIEGET